MNVILSGAINLYKNQELANSEGYDAYYKGVPSYDCPYHFENIGMFDSWMDGWVIAKQFDV